MHPYSSSVSAVLQKNRQEVSHYVVKLKDRVDRGGFRSMEGRMIRMVEGRGRQKVNFHVR